MKKIFTIIILALPLFLPLRIFAMTPTSLDAGLVGHWTFDGKDMVQNVADSSGQGNNGNLVGYTSTTTVAGKIGQALSFNGTSQSFTRSNMSSINFGTGDFSVSFWMKPVSSWGTNTTVGVIGQKAGDSSNGWQIYQDTVVGIGKLDMRITQQNNFVTTSIIPTNKWTHATFVRILGSTFWYINGSLDASGFNASNVSDVSAPFNVGYAQTWGAYYKGTLDDVHIYNRGLTSAEVKQLYRSNTGILK